MPESGLPIRVYKEYDMWHVDYGEGETEDYAGRGGGRGGSRRGGTGRRAHRGRRGITTSSLQEECASCAPARQLRRQKNPPKRGFLRSG